MLELIDVSKSYGQRAALRRTSLAFAPRRTTVLIGPSGCGKSTLLRIVLGLVRADSGMVRFDGEAIAAPNLLAFRRRTGYVIQDGGLFPHLTARENAALVARHLGWSKNRVDERLCALAELTRFPTDALDRYPIQLSGGQRQRVSLMRALMLDPDLLLLDEPLGALDPMIRSDLQADLRAAFEKLAKTVVMVTHDLGEAAFLGAEIVLLEGGAVVQKGTLDDLAQRPATEFVTRFISAQRGLTATPSGGPGGAAW